MINLELSQKLSKAVKARAKRPFDNAFVGILGYYPGAWYIEGFACPKGGMFPVEHAWLEVDGEIVDPTFCNRSLPIPKADQFMGVKRSEPTLAAAYFPVLRLNQAEVYQFIRKTRQTHFMWFWWDRTIFTDEQRQQYKTAQQAAMEFKEGVAIE